MTPTHCRVRHDPANNSYGDCLRACVATILDMMPELIPHFAADGVTGDEAMQIMRYWMKPKGLAPFIIGYPGEIERADLLEMMRTVNPASSYILFGGTAGGGDHCVVCQGGEIVHNPAWYGGEIVGPLSTGDWQVLVIGRV